MIESNILFHYYTKNNIHELNALTRNTCEKELINILNFLCDTYGLNAKIIFTTKEDGGVKEYWKVVSENANGILAIVGIITLFLSVFDGKEDISDLERNIDICKKKLEIQVLREKEFFKDPIECMLVDEHEENALKALEDLNKNKKIITSRSNLFKALKDDDQVLKFGVASDVSDFEELLTEKDDFDHFIIPSPEKVSEPNDNIEISLISPVFRSRRYKWRGLIDDDVVTFKVADRNFNKIIKDIKFPFRDGDIMECSIKKRGS